MADPDKVARAVKAWDWFTDTSTLLKAIGGSAPALLVARLTGTDWKTPVPWLLTLLAFAAGVLVVKLTEALTLKVRHVVHPPHLVVDAASGTKGSILLEHSGAPTSYWADGRIVRTLDGSPNPAQQRFQCDLILKNVLRGGSVLVRDGQWATIVLGEVKTTQIGQQTNLYIRRGKYGDDVGVTDAGVSVEITIRSKPPLKAGLLKKQYRVVRNGNQVELTEENA